METILYRTRLVWFMVLPFLLALVSPWNGLVTGFVIFMTFYFMLQKDITIFRYLSPIVSGLAIVSLSVELSLPLAVITGGYLYSVLFWFLTYLLWPE